MALVVANKDLVVDNKVLGVDKLVEKRGSMARNRALVVDKLAISTS